MPYVRRESTRLGVRKPTIGFLVDSVQESYQWSLLSGIADAARHANAVVLCFAGDVIDGSRAERNAIFDLAGRSVAGLVIASGAIGNRIGTEGLERFCDRLSPLPICSIATPLVGTSSVCIDNAAGVRVAVQHLVNVHERRRIAYVRGPIANVEAESRYEAYAEALRDENIALLPELVIVGDFEERSGQNAAKQLMMKRPPDAIMAANDRMALGVLDELARRGVRVPDDIVVVGFDDIEESRFSLPPLTTMRQPLYEQGGDAVRVLLAQIRGGPAENITRHTEIMLRRSCGCLGADVEPNVFAIDGAQASRNFEIAFIERRQLIVAAIARAARGELGHGGDDWAERLTNALGEQMRDGASQALLRVYDDVLRRRAASHEALAVCNDVLSALRADALRCLQGNSARRDYLENVIHRMRVMTADAMAQAQAHERIHGDLRAREVGRAAAAMASARDADELANAMLRHMTTLGVRRCHVVDITSAGMARVVLVAAHEAAPKPDVGTVREVLDLLMDGAENVFVTYALTFDGISGTILVLKVGATMGYVCETIADVFAAWYRQRMPG